jgi:hypothetical protein
LSPANGCEVGDHTKIGVFVEIQKSAKIEILDPPSLPERASFPKPSLFGLGGLGAGLVLGLGIALIFEFWNKSLWTKEDIEFYLGVPALALIPSIESGTGKRKATRRDVNIGAKLHSVCARRAAPPHAACHEYCA